MLGREVAPRSEWEPIASLPSNLFVRMMLISSALLVCVVLPYRIGRSETLFL
jgi:hypothetical protein